MRFRLLRFFFQANRATVRAEFDDAVALRVPHLVSEYAGSVLHRERFAKEVEFTVKDVVTENEARARIADELFTDNEGLRDSIRLRLLGIFDSNTDRKSVV